MKNINASGFTLIELSVTAFLLVALGAGILGLQYIIGNVEVRSFSSFTNVEGTNRAIRQLQKEIRTARTSDSGAFLFDAATSNSITFYSDIDFDGLTDKVTYTRVNNTLTKSVIKPQGYPASYLPQNAKTTIITDIVRNNTTPVFYYYNGNWPQDTTNNPLATPANLSNIKLVRIYLRINQNSNDTRNDYILDTSVSVRMVKTNL